MSIFVLLKGAERVKGKQAEHPKHTRLAAVLMISSKSPQLHCPRDDF